MEYKSNQHRQMAKVKNILSQIFFPKRLESSSHESYSGSCGDHAQWSLNPENGELRITGTGPLYDFFGEKEVPWESRFLLLPRPYPHIHTRQCHPAGKPSVCRL